eukprot:778053-Rhodomonas_salina.1
MRTPPPNKDKDTNKNNEQERGPGPGHEQGQGQGQERKVVLAWPLRLVSLWWCVISWSPKTIPPRQYRVVPFTLENNTQPDESHIPSYITSITQHHTPSSVPRTLSCFA